MPYRHTGIGVYLHSFFNLGARWGGWSTPRSGRFTPGKEIRYPSYRRLGGPQGRSGREREISPPAGILSPDRPARSESLYRLSYPGPHMHVTNAITRGTEISHSCYTVRIPLYTKCTDILHKAEHCPFCFSEIAAQNFGSLNRQRLASLPTTHRPIWIYRIKNIRCVTSGMRITF